ncbi:uncharacterized protein DSM5745_06158 [Aspergillus mulundensis]|uniref:Protein kinase domain-containing protein n=1 Tax=Aspergillus mulundensis TaxID=1810919 RepID=A0A3D8RZ43_9EURO|nr:hypothetical protein DSM5745_06158 [Aspergillus mulundensis]RDW79306.1 hypothetical protein DSM5745_06158 [Aspergillus mulundensis]
MDDRSIMSCDSSDSRSRSVSESSVSVSSKLPFLNRPIEFLEYYPKRRFHPVHLMDTFQDNRYRVIRKLGYGSFSTVWLARDTQLNRYVALKICQADPENQSDCEAEDDTSSSTETQIYERLAASHVPHPGSSHYLPLLDSFRFSGPNGTHQTLVYEPMAASVTEVKDALFPDGPFPLGTAKAILWQTLLGLDFMLENDVVHGDVQPRNLLFTLDELKDVPEAELAQDTDIPLTPCLETELEGGVKGPRYLVPADSLMRYLDISRPFTIKISDLGGSFRTSHPPSTPSPPLHLRGPETLFQRSISEKQDMWSFGCLVFEFITGIPLFDLSDHPVSEITDDMHFIDMYNILGFPDDERARDTHWPNWRKFFTPAGRPVNHFERRRERDFDRGGKPIGTSRTLEELLEDGIAGRLEGEALGTTKGLLRGLLQFDAEKRFTTKDVLRHKWFQEQRGSH